MYKERNKSEKVKDALGLTERETRHSRETVSLQVTQTTIKTHTEAESILLQLGQLLGFDTYTPDPSEVAYEEPLSVYSTFKDLPPFTHEDFLRTVKEVDVIWFKEDFPEMCFEIEHTTGVSLGLLRLYHIRKFNAKLFIVAPIEVKNKYDNEINKEPFRLIQNRYRFKSYEELAQFYDVAKFYEDIRKKFMEIEKI